MPLVTCPKCKTEHYVQSKQDNTLCKKCNGLARSKKAVARKPPRKGAMVPCQQCGTSFYARPSRIEAGNDKYCSRKCAGEAKRIIRTVSCPWCGRHYVKRANQIYCSRSCAASANHAVSGRQITQGRRCIICEQPFTHGVSSTICSNACLSVHRKGLGIQQTSYSLESDPWETGEIQLDRFASDMFRQPDPVLGF